MHTGTLIRHLLSFIFDLGQCSSHHLIRTLVHQAVKVASTRQDFGPLFPSQGL